MKHRDFSSSPQISKRMSNTKAKGNKYEVMIAKHLFHLGYRYRLNYKLLPGSPDIAITKYKVAIFIDGTFWHGKDWDRKKITIKSNRDYWIPKIEENIKRDYVNDQKLHELGWRTVHIWDTDIKRNADTFIDMIVELCSQYDN